MNEYKPIGINTAIDLLTEVFGQPVYYIPGTTQSSSVDSYNVSVASEDEYDRLSQFGTPVVGSFTIAGGKYKVYDKVTGKLVDKEYSDFEFPLATIVDFSRPKYITKTPTIGSNGTVKEIFGFEDAKISIRGICIDDPSRSEQKTAKEQQLALWALNDIADSLSILKGKIFFEKNITRIVMEDIQFSAVQGKPGMIQFEIPAVSDEDFLIMDI